MSSRQIRKLQQQRELEQAQLKIHVPSSEDESEEEAFQAASKQSLFANLAALEDQGDNEDGDEIDAEKPCTKVQSDDDNENAEMATSIVPKRTKKSKKRKSKKAAVQANSEMENNADDIDAALAELNIKARKNGLVETAAPALDTEYERVCKLLGINSQHLKVANEMKNLFGRAAIEVNEDASGAIPGRRGRRHMPQQVDLETALKGHHLPGKGLPELSLRRNIFIQGKDDWPRGTTGGLIMEVLNDDLIDGTVTYRFVHDQTYNTVQKQFDYFVEMGEPTNLIGLLQRNPYHISLLLQVSKIAKNQSDHALSNDLVERALFTFARASLSSFSSKVAQGKARLEFARPENRELWLAGFHYIKSLIMKGTYRTALEWAKLLLSLDLEHDPYCMTLMVHHLALRAHQFEWLLEFGETKRFKESPIAAHTAPSLAYASMQLKQGAKCRELLSHSIQQMPWMFSKLFQELNLTDPPPSIWGVLPETQPQILYTELYIRQTKDLWNAPEATSLLVEVAHSTAKLSKPEPKILDSAEITLDVARFVYLDNTPALMSLVPSKLMHRQNNSDSDPLPPEKNLFSWPSQRRLFARNSDEEILWRGRGNPHNHMEQAPPNLNAIDFVEREGDPVDEASLRAELNRRFDEEDTDRVLEGMRRNGQPIEGRGLVARAIHAIFNFGGHWSDSESVVEEEGHDGGDDDDDEPVEELPHARPPGSFD